MYKSGF
jgi:protein arginine N-methyltransferase 3